MSSKDWDDTTPHPWRRYAARLTDIIVLGSVAWFVMGVVLYGVNPGVADQIFSGESNMAADGMLNLLLVLPIIAVLIGLTGSSLGKWVFGIRVSKDGKPIGFLRALKRELSVWFFGMGIGFPLASLVTLILSFNKLKDHQVTRWDAKGGFIITHRPQTNATLAMMWTAVVGLLLMSIGLAALGSL
jgi:uncharacterized RDD family membrane protein YckC